MAEREKNSRRQHCPGQAGAEIRCVTMTLTFCCGRSSDFDPYPAIDIEKTGKKLKDLIGESGYSIRAIQELLHLSCPQPIYRWMKGQTLPTVDHLYALARIFHLHMEELLVQKEKNGAELFVLEKILTKHDYAFNISVK